MKGYAIRVTPEAEQDIQEIKKYVVKRFGRATWIETFQILKNSMQVLRDFPESEDIPAELEQFEIMGYREVVSGQNRIIYNIINQQVVIYLVADTRRDLVAILNKRLFRM